MSSEEQGTEPERSRRGDGDRTVCTSCRGTGHVISNLGGTGHKVTCPWCGGTGEFVAARDAQQMPAERGK